MDISEAEFKEAVATLNKCFAKAFWWWILCLLMCQPKCISPQFNSLHDKTKFLERTAAEINKRWKAEGKDTELVIKKMLKYAVWSKTPTPYGRDWTLLVQVGKKMPRKSLFLATVPQPVDTDPDSVEVPDAGVSSPVHPVPAPEPAGNGEEAAPAEEATPAEEAAPAEGAEEAAPAEQQ